MWKTEKEQKSTYDMYIQRLKIIDDEIKLAISNCTAFPDWEEDYEGRGSEGYEEYQDAKSCFFYTREVVLELKKRKAMMEKEVKAYNRANKSRVK